MFIEEQNGFTDAIGGCPHKMTLMITDERPFDTESPGNDQGQRVEMSCIDVSRQIKTADDVAIYAMDRCR